jgi:hypothetical protein
MRTLRLSLALLVAFAVLFLAENRSTSGVLVITGDVVEWDPDRSITVANEQTDPRGIRIDVRGVARGLKPALYDGRDAVTDHDGDRDAIRSGARVSVWYQSIGEHFPVAVKVLVLDPR